jgi:hypothetical protein
MVYRLCIVFLTILSSCSPQTRFNNIVKKHPYVLDDFIISQWDTVFLPGIKFDTILKTTGGRDTFFIAKTFTTITTAPGQIIVNTAQPDTNFIKPLYELHREPIGAEGPPKWLYVLISILTILVLFLFGYIFGNSKK